MEELSKDKWTMVYEGRIFNVFGIISNSGDTIFQARAKPAPSLFSYYPGKDKRSIEVALERAKADADGNF